MFWLIDFNWKQDGRNFNKGHACVPNKVFGSVRDDCLLFNLVYKNNVDSVYFPEDQRFYLKNEFECRTQRRPHYSLRAFARDMQMSASTMSDFFNGKSGLSKDRIFHLSKLLTLDVAHKQHWWDLVESKFGKNPESKKLALVRVQSRSLSAKNRLALEQFQSVSEWQHFAILELIEMSPDYNNTKKIAAALGITNKLVKESINRLIKLQMLESMESGWRTVQNSTLVDDETSSLAVKNFHVQVLKKALHAIENQDSFSRESQSIVFGIPKDKIPELKKELQIQIPTILLKFAKSDSNKTLYCLSAHLFSLMNKDIK